MIMNKKGVSPLVATILLIAFAVSVGAVVMNWASTSTGIESEDNCVGVSLDILTIAGDVQACFDRSNSKLVLDVENGGVAIEGIRASYVGTQSGYFDFLGHISPGVLKKVELDYNPVALGEIKSVKITPFLKKEMVNVYCSNEGVTISRIFDCK